MKPSLMTIALIGAGLLGASACGAAQVPAYGSDQAPTYNAPAYDAPAYGSGQDQAGTANPGAVNYVEGSVALDGQPLRRRDVGRATMEAGSVLSTRTGRAEVLLTPGVFLRVDNNSAIKMISPDVTPTEVEVVRGRAAIEADELYAQNDLEVVDGAVKTQLLKPGFYEFNADKPAVEVFVGKAEVRMGDGLSRTVKGHHEMALAENARSKPANFDAVGAEDQFYNWSSLRSQYLAEANNQIAGNYAGVAGFYPGWYWDPYMWDYTFIGMGPYWSPFGFGFFPPWGWYGGRWGGGFYGRGYYGGGFGRRGGGFGGGRMGGGFGGGGFHGGGGGGGGRR
jgi:hypothetical protein